MGDVILITSGKGGVGKTTFAANLGAALSRRGKTVCAVDTDMGLRNLDLALGLENNAVYDFVDVVTEICTVNDALLKVPGFDSFDFIPAPQSRNCDYITADMMKQFIDIIRDKYDYILMDSPAGIDRGFRNAASAADSAVVIIQPFIASVRDADRTVDCLDNAGIKSIKTVINQMIPDYVADGVFMNVDKILDLVGTELLGIIPWDINISRCQAEGKTVIDEEDALSAAAYKNIAARLEGEVVPIADMNPKKKGFFKRLKEAFKS